MIEIILNGSFCLLRESFFNMIWVEGLLSGPVEPTCYKDWASAGSLLPLTETHAGMAIWAPPKAPSLWAPFYRFCHSPLTD